MECGEIIHDIPDMIKNMMYTNIGYIGNLSISHKTEN